VTRLSSGLERGSVSHRARLFTGLYVACVLVFFVGVAGFYRPGLGFTSMLLFGRDFEARVIPELRHEPHFVVAAKGYDGQFYAQLAAKPVPWDPDVQRALDNPPYRSGRIVTSLVAYALAGGNPARAMHLFAVQNIVVWCGLAWLLLAWFPPGTAWDFVCWAGLLFSAGTLMSVCRALPDLSAFTLIVAALRLWERKRPTATASLLGLAGLVRETSILGAAMLAERPNDRRSAWRTLGRLALVVSPAVALMLVLRFSVGKSGAVSDNFGLPFAGLIKRIVLIGHDGIVKSAGVVLTLASIVVQAGFFAFRARLGEARGRLGLVYVVLFAFTNEAIWSGYPGSAPRVLLPLLFAFNLSVPRTPRHWPLLLLGNLSVVTGWHNLMHPPKPAAAATTAGIQPVREAACAAGARAHGGGARRDVRCCTKERTLFGTTLPFGYAAYTNKGASG
jgi:hypothetical protein